MVKNIAIILAAAALPMTAVAEMTVKINGSLDNQYGTVRQSKAFRYKTDKKLNNNAFVNNGKIQVKADAESESGLKYGGMMELNANTSASKTGNSNILNKAMVYAESGFGRLEAGTADGVGGAFKDGAFDALSAGTGGIEGDAVLWLNGTTASLPNASAQDTDAIFILSPDLAVSHDASGSANKINYFTPKWNGLQLGLSYVPDSATKGTITTANKQAPDVFDDSTEALDGKDPKYKPGYKNILDMGLKYDANCRDVAIASYASVQFGQSKKYKDSTGVHARRPLHAWEIGSAATYRNFTLGASYGDWGLSGIYKSITNNYKRRSSFYTVGAGYSWNDLSASLTYLNSRAAAGRHGGISQNRYDQAQLLSFGVDYKLLPGVKTYVEATHFKLSQQAISFNKGNVVLTGVKLSF